MKCVSRKWWISIGVTVGLLALLGAAGAVVAQKPEPGDPTPSASSTPMQKPGRGTPVPGVRLPLPQEPGPSDPVPSVSAPLAPGGGPSEAMAFSYQGRLMDGSAPANGNYDFIINLYDDPTVGMGTLVGTCTNVGTGSLLSQPVQNGIFTFYLYCGSNNSSMFTGGERWIDVQVRRTGTTTYTQLLRQPISPAPYAFSLYPGAQIAGGVASPSAAISATQTLGAPWSAAFAMYGYSPNVGIYGRGGVQGVQGFGHYAGVRGDGGLLGVQGVANQYGVYGWANWSTENAYGVYGGTASTHGHGGHFVNTDTSSSISQTGVWAGTYWGNIFEGHEVDQYGQSVNRAFRVSWSGNVYADGTYYGAGGVSAGSADLAEMVAPGETELEPGDVLVIGPDGQMIRGSEPYQSSVAGVYSKEPGFIAGNKLDEDGNPLETGHIPLAIVGIVPVKVSAENGAIHPGDLLATSSTPGHAMKAGPNPPVGTVIGKALGTLAVGKGVIQMLVTLQ